MKDIISCDVQLKMSLSSGSICQSDMKILFSHQYFRWSFSCTALFCLLVFHLLLVWTATLLFTIISSSELSDPVSDTYYKLPLSFYHLSSFIFSQICFFLKLCSHSLYNPLLVSILLTKSPGYYDSFFSSIALMFLIYTVIIII